MNTDRPTKKSINTTVSDQSPVQILRKALESVLVELDINASALKFEHPAIESHGDYATNIALIAFGKKGKELDSKNPGDLATLIVETLQKQKDLSTIVSSISVEGPGFINFHLAPAVLIHELATITQLKDGYGRNTSSPKRVFIEYAHPNTHKEIHIGHLRTLTTGEALARILEASGARVFRANYQGDIGPHVAKAVYGLKNILKEEKLGLATVRAWSSTDKAHLLGRAYVRGNEVYETNKPDVDKLNMELYMGIGEDFPLYQETRQWSLDYYDEFYTRFYTHFDHLFFESQMVDCGKKRVLENVGKIFEKNEGAIIFPGEKYGLHTRVFLTKVGNPTYEGKEMCNGFSEYEAFPFDQKIHVVGKDQGGYFEVVFKALELIDPKKFEGKQHHLAMGLVSLKDRKMSSRTGEILTVDWLIGEVNKQVEAQFSEAKIQGEDREKVIEEVAIGAIKYSVLRVATSQDAVFDIEKSISLAGDSGPYLQYTYARCQSVLRQMTNDKLQMTNEGIALNSEEESVLRYLSRFPEVVEEAGRKLEPSVVANYLYELAKRFNTFYHDHSVLKAENEATRDFRIQLTQATAQVLKNGLYLLGIKAPERM